MTGHVTTAPEETTTLPALLSPAASARRQQILEQLQADPLRMPTSEELRVVCPPCQESSRAGTRAERNGRAR